VMNVYFKERSGSDATEESVEYLAYVLMNCSRLPKGMLCGCILFYFFAFWILCACWGSCVRVSLLWK
jgi:hypothetical protein